MRMCIAILLCLLLSACREPTARKHEYSWTVMGTSASLTVYGTDEATTARLNAIARNTFDAANTRFSLYRADSELSQFNAAGTNAVAISKDLYALLDICERYHKLTGGAFDPTVAPAVLQWGFSGGRKPDRIPELDIVEALRRRIGFEHINFDRQQARFTKPHMKLDLGGIAKGYAIDRAFDLITAAHHGPVLLNLGGEMRVQGRPNPSRPWRIGVRNPFDRETIVGVLALPSGKATATSGHYERFVTLEGTRFSHIIDPRTAMPATGMAGVTVLCEHSATADALSTALFVLGLEAGGQLAGQIDGVEALFIPDRQPIEIHVTTGMLSVFTPEPEWRGALQQLAP